VKIGFSSNKTFFIVKKKKKLFSNIALPRENWHIESCLHLSPIDKDVLRKPWLFGDLINYDFEVFPLNGLLQHLQYI
jgi:hypothetical protein